MKVLRKTLVASAIATMGLGFSMGASAQTWVANQGPFEIIGDVVVDNTLKGGPASNFGCKVRMQGNLLGTTAGVLNFVITAVQVLNNGWADGAAPWSAGCHTVSTSDANGTTLPWTGAANGTNVTITGLYFNAVGSGQPGCGTNGTTTGGLPNRDPASTMTAQWRQSLASLPSGPLRSASTTIFMADMSAPTVPVVDSDPAGDCRIAGVLNMSRRMGPIVQ